MTGTPEVTPEVVRMLGVLHGEMSRAQLMALLGLKDEKHFRIRYQQAAVPPDRPRAAVAGDASGRVSQKRR